MIYKTILMLSTALSCSAWAHGNRAQQAHDAVNEALLVVQRDEPRETLRGFKSVAAEMAGHEVFQVVVGYEDGHLLNYRCWEDESVDPVVWKCDKQQ